MQLINDHRVTFIKGIFQDTIKELEEKILKINDHHLIVHYDADLYSSIIFTSPHPLDQKNDPDAADLEILFTK